MYTKELIAEMIQHYHECSGETISEETAELYLHALADLFVIAEDILRDNPELLPREKSAMLTTSL